MKQSTTSTTVLTTPQATTPIATSPIPITVGLDLGDRYSHFCVLDAGGRAQEPGKVAMLRKNLAALFERIAPARLILEVGGQSPRVSRLAQSAGLEVIVANPRRVQLITRNDRKNERTDAELLARLGRADPHLLSPVQHRSAQCQSDLAVGRARDVAVASRTGLINHVRGAIKSYGQRLPTCSPDSFHKRVVSHLPVELGPRADADRAADRSGHGADQEVRLAHRATCSRALSRAENIAPGKRRRPRDRADLRADVGHSAARVAFTSGRAVPWPRAAHTRFGRVFATTAAHPKPAIQRCAVCW